MSAIKYCTIYFGFVFACIVFVNSQLHCILNLSLYVNRLCKNNSKIFRSFFRFKYFNSLMKNTENCHNYLFLGVLVSIDHWQYTKIWIVVDYEFLIAIVPSRFKVPAAPVLCLVSLINVISKHVGLWVVFPLYELWL